MPVDREKIRQAAEKLVEKEKFDKAIVEFRKLVADDPKDVRTLLRIGDLQLKLKSGQDGEKTRYEDSIGTYEQVGEYYFREGFAVKAIAVYKQIRGIITRHCAHLEGKYGHIVPRLAEIYTQLGLTSDALAAYDEVATRMRQEGRERDALDIFKKVVELDPQNPIVHLRVADSRARLGDIDKAVEAFGEAARIMLKLNRLDDAIKVLERLLEYRQEAEYALLCGETYLQRNGPNDAMTALSKLQIAFKANPKDLHTLSVLAKAFDAINQPKKAVEVLKEAARVARDKDESEFTRLTELLKQRAPDDPAVDQLVKQAVQRSSVEIAVAEASEEELGETEALDGSLEEELEIGDGDLEVEIESAAPSSTTLDAAARQLVQDAEQLYLAGRMPEAVDLLRQSIAGGAYGPATPQLRMKLSDLLLEAGDQRGAAGEKLVMARELIELGAGDRALAALDEVLLLEPGHPAALSMRAQLAPAAQSQVAAYPQAAADPFSELGANVPLASYDVESGGVDEVLHRTGPHSQAGYAYADGLEGGGTIAMEGSLDFAAEGFGAPPMASRRGGHMAVPLPSALAGLDERALEEADLLAELGQFGEARAILLVQLQNNPNHPLIMDRLAELDTLAGSQPAAMPAPAPEAHPSAQGYYADPRQSWANLDPQQYATGGYPAAQVPQHVPQQSMAPESDPYAQAGYAPTSGAYQTGHAAAMHPGDAYPPAPDPYQQQAYDPHAAAAYAAQQAQYSPYDTGQYAQAQLPADPAPAVPAAAPQGAGIRHEVAEGDNQTHYDLGVAYMEMGMASQAVSELTLAARDPIRECVCMSMIGTIHLQTGEIDAGLEALTRALNAPHKTREQELALGYEIANTYEAKGMVEQALYYFDWLTQIDPSYEDMRGSVGDRIRRLHAGSGPQPVPGAHGYPVPGAGHGQR